MGKNSMKHLAKLERFLLKSANYCALNIYLLGLPLFLYQKLKKHLNSLSVILVP